MPIHAQGTDPTTTQLLGLLGIVVQGVNGQIGLQCQPGAHPGDGIVVCGPPSAFDGLVDLGVVPGACRSGT